MQANLKKLVIYVHRSETQTIHIVNATTLLIILQPCMTFSNSL